MALANSLALGTGKLTEDLTNFIESNVPKLKKKNQAVLAFLDNRIAKEVTDQLSYECRTNDVIFELFRGLRTHLTKFLKSDGNLFLLKNIDFKENDLERA